MAGKRIIVFSLLALVGLALALFASSGTNAQSYKPTFSYTVADNTHDVVSDTTNVIAIPGPDYNYEDSSLYTFSPIDGWSEDGTAIDIADGMGTLTANVWVGLLGGPCSVNLPPVFVLENASVDPSFELTPAETYWVLKKHADYEIPVRDKCENDVDDDADTKVNDGCPAIGPAEAGADCDNDVDDDADSYSALYQNGVNDGCPAVDTPELLTDPIIPDYLEAVPEFINAILDPDGPGGDDPLTTRARYVGYTDSVAGMNVIVQFLDLAPGQMMPLGGIKAQMGPELGNPSLVILDNPVSQEEAPGAISDFCTPLNTTTVLYGTTVANQYDATGGGTTARMNPPENTGVLGTGTHMARNYSQSERDADGDGHENDLDACRFTSDVGWDPRGLAAQPGLDTDGDGLPDSCDPDITGTTGDPDLIDCNFPNSTQTDCDGDGYNNRQDTCPLVPNGCIVASCSDYFPPIFDPTWDNQADDDGFEPNADLGPGPDSIANACDDSDDDGLEAGGGTAPGSGNCNDGIDNDADNKIDGNDPECQPYMDKADASPWGANPGTGQFYHALPWTAVTINGAVDTDGDGYSDSLEALLGSCADDTLPTPGTCETQGFQAGTDPEDSTPESLVIDATLTVGAGSPPMSGGFPALDVPQSCSDDEDNDLDGLTDALDNTDLGCDPADDSYDGDADHDGVVDDGGTDNCGKAGTCSIWNPEQVDSDADTVGDACDADIVGDSDADTVVDRCDNCPDYGASADQTNTDADLEADGASVVGDSLGDVCDNDDDNDGFSDVVETYLPTDPLDNCVLNPPGTAVDAWPLDNNKDHFVTVGGDVLPYRGKIGSTGGPPPVGNWLQRLDINADNFITVGGDVLPFRGNIGASCS